MAVPILEIFNFFPKYDRDIKTSNGVDVGLRKVEYTQLYPNFLKIEKLFQNTLVQIKHPKDYQ